MELIVVSPPDYFEGEGILFNQFFADGLQLLHIRKTEDNTEKFRKLMKEINPAYYPLVSIHQHHELAAEFSIKRLHYQEHKRKAMDVARLQELKEKGYQLSSSVHELGTLTELAYLDYVFFGPVFNSISKIGYNTSLRDDFVLPPHQVKVFAIGGISTDRLARLRQMNFDGAAVLGTIWHQDAAPAEELKKLINAINELQDDH